MREVRLTPGLSIDRVVYLSREQKATNVEPRDTDYTLLSARERRPG